VGEKEKRSALITWEIGKAAWSRYFVKCNVMEDMTTCRGV
jgi:hypothetical protein